MTHCCWRQLEMTHDMCSTCTTQPYIGKDGIIQTLLVVALNNPRT